jgi:hypothetical protein
VFSDSQTIPVSGTMLMETKVFELIYPQVQHFRVHLCYFWIENAAGLHSIVDFRDRRSTRTELAMLRDLCGYAMLYTSRLRLSLSSPTSPSTKKERLQQALPFSAL